MHEGQAMLLRDALLDPEQIHVYSVLYELTSWSSLFWERAAGLQLYGWSPSALSGRKGQRQSRWTIMRALQELENWNKIIKKSSFVCFFLRTFNLAVLIIRWRGRCEYDLTQCDAFHARWIIIFSGVIVYYKCRQLIHWNHYYLTSTASGVVGIRGCLNTSWIGWHISYRGLMFGQEQHWCLFRHRPP